jgi:trans-aconitate methyltransferase
MNDFMAESHSPECAPKSEIPGNVIEAAFDHMQCAISSHLEQLEQLECWLIKRGAAGVIVPLYYPESGNPTGISIECSKEDLDRAIQDMNSLSEAISSLMSVLSGAEDSELAISIKRPNETDYFRKVDVVEEPSDKEYSELTYGCREVSIINPDGTTWATIVTRLHPGNYNQVHGKVPGNGERQLAIRFDPENGPERLCGVHVRFDQAVSVKGKNLGPHVDIGDAGFRREIKLMQAIHNQGNTSPSMALGKPLVVSSAFAALPHDNTADVPDKGGSITFSHEGPAAYYHNKMPDDFDLEELIRQISSIGTKPQASYATEAQEPMDSIFKPSESLTLPKILEAIDQDTNLRFPDRVFEIIIREALLYELERTSRLNPGAQILDLGGGSGVISSDIANRLGGGAQATVIDSSTGMLDASNNTPNITAYHGDMTDIDLFTSPNSVDFAMSLMALHYLSSDQLSGVFEHLEIAMREGSVGLFSMIHPNAMGEYEPRDPGKKSQQHTHKLSNTKNEVAEYAHWPEHLEALARKAGFDVTTHTINLENLVKFVGNDKDKQALVEGLLAKFVDTDDNGQETRFYEEKLNQGSRITFLVIEKTKTIDLRDTAKREAQTVNA